MFLGLSTQDILGHIVICCGGLFCACYGINVASGLYLLVPLALPFPILTIKNISTLPNVSWAGEQIFLFPALQVNKYMILCFEGNLSQTSSNCKAPRGINNETFLEILEYYRKYRRFSCRTILFKKKLVFGNSLRHDFKKSTL